MDVGTLKEYWGKVAVQAIALREELCKVPKSGVFHQDLSEENGPLYKSLQGIAAVGWNAVPQDLGASGVDYEAVVAGVGALFAAGAAMVVADHAEEGRGATTAKGVPASVVATEPSR